MTVLKVSEHNPVVDANEGLIRVVLNLLDEAFDKKSWHGPNLRGSIRGVSAAQAAWRIAPDRHNIWELTLHAAYWKYVVRRRLSGGKRGSFVLPGTNFFTRPIELSESAWKKDVEILVAEHRALRRTTSITPARSASSCVFARCSRARPLHLQKRTHVAEPRCHFERLRTICNREDHRRGAMRRARIEMGGADELKEECRQSWGIGLIDSVGRDIAYALRVLVTIPGFTASVALSLALGIGANTAIFSLIDAVMWRMLPVKDPAGLWVIDPGLTFQQYRTLRDSNTVADLAAYSTVRLNVSVDGNAEPTADGQLVSGNYFSLLGVNPAAGRSISVEDDRIPNGHPVAMISYGYWKRRFGQTPSVLGKAISISGVPFTIIGITPPEFFGVEVGMAPDAFVPVMMQPTAMPAFENLLDSPIIYRTWLTTVGRLRPGVQAPQAASALEALWRTELPEGSPKIPGAATQRLIMKPASSGLSSLRSQFSQPLFVLMAVVVVVLLIACANTANLLLARAAARRQEFAMRLALGAGRWRLTRQLLVESVVLAALGGVCGILLARWAIRLLVIYMSSGRSPIALDLNPNLRILGFTAAVSIATGILFGLAPATRATRVDLWPALKNLGSLPSRGRGLGPGKVLAVFQVALSLVLLIGAGLFARSLQKLNGENFGTSRESVFIVRVE